MSTLNKLNLGFDYFLCMTHNVVVDIGDQEQHMDKFCVNDEGKPMARACSFLGQFYNIKKPAVKLSNDISVKLVRRINEKKNEERFEKKYEEKLNKRKRDQELYAKLLPIGDSILNLDVVEL